MSVQHGNLETPLEGLPAAQASEDPDAGCHASASSMPEAGQPRAQTYLPPHEVALPAMSIHVFKGAGEEEWLLGEGGSGKVYSVEDPRSGDGAALKLAKVASPDSVKRLLWERQMANSLVHPAIVPINDAFYDPKLGVVGLLMPLLGVNLSDALKRHHMPEDAAMLVFIQLTAILRALHRAGIKHGDIKLNNLLLDLDASGRISLADFGSVVRLAPSHAPVAGMPATSLSRSNSDGPGILSTEDAFYASGGLHTPCMVPPEWHANVHTYKQDWYAAGMVLFQLLSHVKWPFVMPKPSTGNKRNDYRESARQNQLTWPHHCLSEVSRPVRELVEGLLQADNGVRWGLHRVLMCDALNMRRCRLAALAMPHLATDLDGFQAERNILLNSANDQSLTVDERCDAEPEATPACAGAAHTLSRFFYRVRLTGRQPRARHLWAELHAVGVPGLCDLSHVTLTVAVASRITIWASTGVTGAVAHTTAAFAQQVVTRCLPTSYMDYIADTVQHTLQHRLCALGLGYFHSALLNQLSRCVSTSRSLTLRLGSTSRSLSSERFVEMMGLMRHAGF